MRNGKSPLQDLSCHMQADDYDGGIKGSLEDIVRQLQRDLSQNERENNYITDDTAATCMPLLANWNTAGSAQAFLTA